MLICFVRKFFGKLKIVSYLLKHFKDFFIFQIDLCFQIVLDGFLKKGSNIHFSKYFR